MNLYDIIQTLKDGLDNTDSSAIYKEYIDGEYEVTITLKRKKKYLPTPPLDIGSPSNNPHYDVSWIF